MFRYYFRTTSPLLLAMERSNSLQMFGTLGDGSIGDATSIRTGATESDVAHVNPNMAILPPGSVVAPIFGTSGGQYSQKSAKDIDLNEVFAGKLMKYWSSLHALRPGLLFFFASLSCAWENSLLPEYSLLRLLFSTKAFLKIS